jgi:hypothetical protein
MRVRLDAIASQHAKTFAKRLGRSTSSFASFAITEYGRRHSGDPVNHSDAVSDSIMSGAFVGVHVNGAIRAGLTKFCERDNRSLSSGLRILLRDALRAHGCMPQLGNDPVIPASNDTAT